MNIKELFGGNLKLYLFLIVLLVAGLWSNGFWIAKTSRLKTQVMGLEADKAELQDVKDSVLSGIDFYKMQNARLSLELILNDCNSFKIHEKIKAIPSDSLMRYADSLLSGPIAADYTSVYDNRNTTQKLLGIPRTLFRHKTEDDGG
jgi:hypothetical protein